MSTLSSEYLAEKSFPSKPRNSLASDEEIFPVHGTERDSVDETCGINTPDSDLNNRKNGDDRGDDTGDDTANISSSDDDDDSYTDAVEDFISTETTQEFTAESHRSPEDDQSQNLSDADVLAKLREKDVTVPAHLMDNLQSIGLADLDRLERLDKTNPGLKRLIMRTRLTGYEVKTVAIDPDIKSNVNEFLRTNIAGNFIISRVLRENYATFYAWLSAHIQTERNAWAVRLKRALELTEKQRKINLDTGDHVIDTALTLKALVQCCSIAAMGAGTQPRTYSSEEPNQTPDDVINPRVPQRVRTIPSQKGSSSLETTSDRPTRSLHHYASVPDIRSTKNQNHPASFSNEDTKQGTTRTACKQTLSTTTHTTNRCSDSKLYQSTNHIITNTADIPVEDYNNVDWKQMTRECMEQMQEICHTFISERKKCLKMLSIKPQQYTSLEEALAAYIQDRNASSNVKKRDIEKRLMALESENRKLIEEMTALQGTLLEKQNNALNLQQQLGHLENILTKDARVLVNKCVGTDEVKPGVKAVQQSSNWSDKLAVSSNGSKITVISPADKSHNRRVSRSNKEFKHASGQFEVVVSDKTSSRPASDDRGSSDTSSDKTKNTRERSLIEISEEKLRMLKERAQKLEDSLHDAISSMSKQGRESELPSNLAPLNTKGLNNGADDHRRLQTNSVAPRIVVIKRPLSNQRRSRSETLLLDTESTSLLSGRSVNLTTHNMSDRSQVQSCLTIVPGKGDTSSKQLINETKNNLQMPNETDQQENTSKEQSPQKKKTPRIISRYRAAGGGMVSKCLRCQKLFSAVDNHKLACYYHTKEKERIEHYDPSGKLVRVMYAWMCCRQPQEIDGCCYGQHI
ncbi:uncharacterized protein LOC131955365 [Physella acuta]|uniref:uncharacterized protein LOC131955365 n=1 Tax=Physella acuta TaxID=109671 RepID=UPI0027DC351E|nr:uncharacterized protein LOC131955365 [Physella acuta]